MNRQKCITVAQLRAALADMPDEMEVFTEGCDCIGPCSGARIYPDDKRHGGDDQPYVLLQRDDH